MRFPSPALSREDDAARELTVAVVGAGIHGSVVAIRLLHEWPDLRMALRLIDPSGGGLAVFRRRTRGQGMDTMRSPGAHHLDVAPDSLLAYARARGREGELGEPYHRPSLSLFMDHSRWVIERLGLAELVRGTAVVSVQQLGRGYRLECADGSILHTRWLVLAPGLAGQERMPEWASRLRREHPTAVAHTEQLDIRGEDVVGRRVLVVGGGLSAATLADAAVARGARVTLLSRHGLEARLFDADPGWVGPKYLRFFQGEPDPEARLRMIQRARGRGSVTPGLLARLRELEAQGQLEILEETEVVEARWDERRDLAAVTCLPCRSQPGRSPRFFERIWCGTGFDARLDRLGWLGAVAHVPVCQGRPVIGPTLELAPRCFVSGWLAELWVGPAARNISGARHSATLIASALRPRLRAPRGPGAPAAGPGDGLVEAAA